MFNKVYPFTSGSEYTASYSISSSYAVQADRILSASTVEYAGRVLKPQSGLPASKDICVITYQQYLQILSGSSYEIC